MSDPLPILRTTRPPTLFNDYAATGALIGTFAVPVPGLGTAVGGLIGGGIGKQKMEDALVHGKKLRNPSMLNFKIFTGILQGAAIGLSILGAALLFELPLIFGLIGGAATLLGPVVGGIRGSVRGKQEMELEMAEAREQQAHQEKLEQARLKSGPDRGKAPAIDYGEHHPAAEAEKRGYRHAENLEQRRGQEQSLEKVH